MTREERLHVALLGPLDVRDASGAALAVGGTQRRAVLAQLALAPGRVVSVDALSLGLWGDEPPTTAVKSIQVHISRLRQVLPANTLLTRAPGYLLDVAPGATDVGRFEALTSQARTALGSGRVAEGADLLRAALDLWRGPAIADLLDHPFALRAAVHLDEARTRAVEDRLAADLDLGRHAEVVGDLEALAEELPLHEGVWVLLMTALYRCGRQADALGAYTRARNRLVDELGVEPGIGLRELERQILDHAVPGPSATTAQPGGHRPPAPPPTQPPGGTKGHPLELRPPSLLVGRDRALELLASATEQMIDGAAAVVAIRGEEGLGKSAVIASFARSVSDRANVVVGRCREHIAVPYGPWTQIVDQLGASSASALLDGDGDDESPERRRIRLFEVVTSALRIAAFDRPQVVVLDDLHWSDDASVELLMHALDELSDSPITFLLAWRDREIVTGHPLNRLVHLLTRTGATWVDLDPLTAPQLALLIEHVAPDTPTTRRDDLAVRIHELTGGIPLFASEVIATVADDLRRPEADGAHHPEPRVPETVHTLVAGRLSAVGPTGREVAEACAVLDEPLTVGLVAALTPGTTPLALLDALDQLVDIGLLHEIDRGYAFAHTAFRHSILSTLRSGRRQRLHAAAYLVLHASSAAPAVLVHHSESAGPLVASADVGRHLRAAGDDAMHRGAFADAQGFYGRCLDRVVVDDLASAQVAYADALGRSGDVSGMKHAATAALEAARCHGASDQTVAQASALLSSFGDGFAVDVEAIASIERARSLVSEPRTWAQMAALIAYHHAMWGSSTAVSMAALQAAVEATPEPCPPDLRGGLLFAEGLVRLADPDLDRRFAVAEQLIELADIDPTTAHRGRGVRLRCLTQMSAGRFDDLADSLDQLLAAAEAEGSWLYLSDCWRWRIAATIASGDVAAAERAIIELEEIGRGPLAGRAFVGTQRMILDWFTGRTDACLAYLDAMRSMMPDGDPVGTDRRLADLIALAALVEADRHDEARDTYEALRPHRDLDRSSGRRATAELALCAQVAAELDDTDAAAELLARLAPYGGQLVVVSWGECTIGSADGYAAQLRSLVHRIIDDEGFARAVAIEQDCGDLLSAQRTARRWQRTSARLATAAPA